jgi:hypothetical protein
LECGAFAPLFLGDALRKQKKRRETATLQKEDFFLWPPLAMDDSGKKMAAIRA